LLIIYVVCLSLEGDIYSLLNITMDFNHHRAVDERKTENGQSEVRIKDSLTIMHVALYGGGKARKPIELNF
jgi:hypothetical protein